MSRPRRPGSKDLPPGLYVSGGRYRLRNPVTGQWVRLGSDRARALAMYEAARQQWAHDEIERQARAVVARLKLAAAGGETLASYCREFREKRLPALLARDGDPLAGKTRADYDRMLRRQVETHETLAVPFCDVDAPLLRRFLAQWIDSPAHYRYMLSLLTRVLAAAVAEGKLPRNPAKDVERPAAPKRRVYIPDEHYVRITAQLEEWESRACDLLYLLSSRPVEALALTDASLRDGVITYTADKTGQAVEIEANADLVAVIEWFRQAKQGWQVISPWLIVYPPGKRKRDIGRRVTVGYLSRRFAAAVVTAGFEAGAYKLKDLRKKGLTDEARIAGAPTAKGGHRTEAMKRYYVTDRLPVRAASNITKIGGKT